MTSPMRKERRGFLQVLYKGPVKEQTIVNNIMHKLPHCPLCIPLLPVVPRPTQIDFKTFGAFFNGPMPP